MVALRRGNALLGKHWRGENSRRRYPAPPVIPSFQSQRRVSLSSESGGKTDMKASTLSAKSGREQVQQKPLLDHIVGDREQLSRDVETERPRGLEVDNEFKLGRLHHG